MIRRRAKAVLVRLMNDSDCCRSNAAGVACYKKRPCAKPRKQQLPNEQAPLKFRIVGPEQEIPAVTCVRLIAQKHRY